MRRDFRKLPKSKSSGLINFHRVEHSVTELANAGIRKYRVKPDITIPVNVETRALNRPAFEVTADAIRSGDIVHQAEIGNIALRLSEGYEKALPSAKAQLDKVFSGFKMEVRSKGANSVYSKVCKWMKKLTKMFRQISKRENIFKMLLEVEFSFLI